MKFQERIRKSFNLFRSVEEARVESELPMYTTGGSFGGRRPDRRFANTIRGSDITTAIYNRLSVDAANVKIRHVKLDEKGRYSSTVSSGLNSCLTVEANIDQGATAFRQDMFQTLLEEGTMVIVPIETGDDPDDTGSTKVETMRVGTVIEWFPLSVRVRCYDDRNGKFIEVVLPKLVVAPVENPFFSVMNERNGTLKRLVRKIGLLDAVDEMIGSGKLDLIIQLPYIIKSDTKRAQAEKRRSELEDQLQSSQFGVAYTDGTEKIVQLNRPVENNLLKNVEALTKLLYSELSLTEEVLNGTASEETMMNYQVRVTKPLLDAVCEAMKRRFLSKTARTQGHSIEYYQDPFALVPPAKFAAMVDILSRNAIISANEVRGYLGLDPVTDDPVADQLVNKNMPAISGGLDPVLELT